MSKRVRGFPRAPTTDDSAKTRRARELAACEAELNALLARYDAGLSGSVVMTVAADGTPRYQVVVTVVGR